MKFKNVDDLFDVTDPRNADEKRICEIPICDLYPFQNHPFKVKDDDEKMIETMESIEKQGVIYPIIVRPRDGQDGYEIIAGHRRTRACELLGFETVPAIIKKLNDAESTIVMVDSNIQREELLCSEKAFAYKMKLEAMKKQGKRNDLTSVQVAEKLSVEVVADEVGTSKDQIRRYIRLTHLIKELLDMADKKSLPFTTAVSLSYLTEKEQRLLLTKIKEIRKPSQIEATKLKAESMATNGGLTNAFIEKLLLPDFSKMQAVEEGQAHNREMTTKPLKGMLTKNKVLQKYFRDDVAEEESYFSTVHLFNEALIKMLSAEGTFTVGQRIVTAAKMYDKLVVHIKMHTGTTGELRFDIDELMTETIGRYHLASKKDDGIRYPMPYMMACVWSVMEEGNAKVCDMIRRDFG